MKLTEYRFPSATGIGDIYACAYKPDNGEYDIVLVIHHGMAEHQERYRGFIEFLCNKFLTEYGRQFFSRQRLSGAGV